MDERKWQRKEWMYILVLVSLIQGIIWYVSFVYAANSTALGYVSFAGTIISIILAVLAIGYTYGESIKQKNSSDTVVNQISRLNEVIKTIQLEASSLEKISTISDELQKLSQSFNEGMYGISETHKSVTNISNLLNNGILSNKNNLDSTNTLDKNELSRIICSMSNSVVDILTILLKSSKKTYKNDQHIVAYICAVFRKYLIDYNEKNTDKIEEDYENMLLGSIILSCATLNALGLIEYDDSGKNYILSEYLENAINDITLKKGGDNPSNIGKLFPYIKSELSETLS